MKNHLTQKSSAEMKQRAVKMSAPMKSQDGRATPRKAFKRKNTSTYNETASENKKTKEVPFNEIEFKFHLKDSSTIFTGFEKFLVAVESWSDGLGEDIVLGYCRSAPECSEIFQVLEAGPRKLMELQLVFMCLEKILLRIADDLDKYYPTGQAIVRKLLASHLQAIFNTLNIKNRSNQIKASLKLLVAMVMLGAPTAKLVMNNVDLGHKVMLPLLHRRDVKDEEDVRTCFIHLILACLLAGDNDIIRKVIQTKGLMENVFQGIEFDRVSTLQLLLSTVLENVIMNTGISKTSKVHMFSDKGLKELGHLYNWQGPGKWKQTIKQKGRQPDAHDAGADDVTSEDKTLAAEIAERFLAEVCTSYKHGTIFLDKTYGLSGRSQNRLMTGFLAYLSGQMNHMLVQKLVLGIVTACPDQLQYFLPHIMHSLVPRDTTKWTTTMKFVMKIYSSLGQNISVLKMKEKVAVGNFVQILMVYTLPTLQVLNTVLPGIKDKSLVVNHVTLGMVRQIADTAVHVLKSLQNLPIYTHTERAEIHNTYKAFVLKNLPDIMSVFGCWDKALALQKSHPDELAKLEDLCGSSLSDVLIQIEQILCLYQDLHPTLLTEHPVILGKLLDGVMGSEVAIDASVTGHMTKVYLLKLMSGTEARRLPWAKQNSSGHTLLYQLLDMLTQISSNNELADITLQLVCKLLESTGQFEMHHDDLHIWLKVVQGSGPAVLEFVSKVMMTYIHNPYPYMDRLCDLDLQSDVAMETTNERKRQIRISDILSLDTIDLADGTETYCPVVGSKRFPFCPLLIVGLDSLEKLETVPTVVCQYMSQIVLHTFHEQVDPRPLCTMLCRYKSTLFLPRLSDYVLTWTETDRSISSGVLTKLRYEELLSENEGVLRQDTDPKSSIQQDLLHLTYLIQLLGKNSDKRCMKHICSVKSSLVASIKEISLKGSEDVIRKETQGTDLSLANLLKPVKQNELLTAVRLVLDHPVVTQFFLGEMNGNRCRKVAKSMTELVTDLLEVIVQQNLQLEDALDFYYQRISSNLQTMTKNEGQMPIFEVLTVLVLKITADQCRQVFNLVLNALDGGNEIEENLLLSLFENFIQRLVSSKFKAIKLTENGMYRLVDCFVKSGSDCDSLFAFFKKFPVLSSQCSERTVEKLFQSAQNCRLVQFFMENNAAVTVKVGELIQQSTHLDSTSAENLQIVIKYLKLADISCGNDGDKGTPAAARIIKLFRSELLALCGTDPVDHSRYLIELARLLTDNDIIGEMWLSKMKKRLTATLEASEGMMCRHIDLLLILYSAHNRPHLLQRCMQCLVTVLGHNKTDTEDNGQDKTDMEDNGQDKTDTEDKLLDIIADCSQEDMQTLATWSELSTYWPRFIKSLLKFAYTKPAALTFITGMLPVIHRLVDLHPGVTLETTVDMVMSHSSFIPVMFGEEGPECNDLLVNLLVKLVEMCPATCHSDHISVFLGAYGASLSLTDQRILKLMHFYEKNEINLSNYKPFMWGEKAVEQHTLRKALGPSLKRVTMVQVIGNIDISKMTHSILHFPLRKTLQDVEPQHAETYKSDSASYDPCFVLPLISQLLVPESVIDCRRFIQTGCLGYTFAALSSHDENMRNAALHILDLFRGHLEVAKTPEKEQIQYLLDVVHNSVPKTKNKMASIITQFLARTAKLLLKPDDHMYTIINGFLLLKPSLDVGNIPEFFKLFNSSAMQYQMERSWMLSLMNDGLRETADYWIFEKRFTFKLLQSFYDSNMSDTQSQMQVLQIVLSACQERRLAVDLCQNHGFLVWIGAAISKLSSDRIQLCESICCILQTVWAAVIEQSQDNKPSKQLSFSVQVLSCLKNLLLYIGNISEEVMMQFVRMLASVLSHLRSMADTIRSPVTQTVSHTEILLLLLHCQNHWTQSKCTVQSVKTILQALGLDVDVLEKTSAKTGRKHNASSFPHRHVRDIEKSTDDPIAEEIDNKKSDDRSRVIAEEIVRVVDVWRSTVADVSAEVVCVVDVVVIRWLLDHISSVRTFQCTESMVKLIHNFILGPRENGLVLTYFATHDTGVSNEVLVDLLNIYTVLAGKYETGGAVGRGTLRFGRTDVVRRLNEVLYEIYKRKHRLSASKMEKNIKRHLQDMIVCDANEEVKSVVIRKMFVEML